MTENLNELRLNDKEKNINIAIIDRMYYKNLGFNGDKYLELPFHQPGIYILSNGEDEIYIGKSSNIQKRLSKHNHNLRYAFLLTTQDSTKFLSDSEISIIEGYLIDIFNNHNILPDGYKLINKVLNENVTLSNDDFKTVLDFMENIAEYLSSFFKISKGTKNKKISDSIKTYKKVFPFIDDFDGVTMYIDECNEKFMIKDYLENPLDNIILNQSYSSTNINNHDDIIKLFDNKNNKKITVLNKVPKFNQHHFWNANIIENIDELICNKINYNDDSINVLIIDYNNIDIDVIKTFIDIYNKKNMISDKKLIIVNIVSGKDDKIKLLKNINIYYNSLTNNENVINYNLDTKEIIKCNNFKYPINEIHIEDEDDYDDCDIFMDGTIKLEYNYNNYVMYPTQCFS